LIELRNQKNGFLLPLPPSTEAATTVTIQGDCKTVVDQLRGRSRPRKLEAYCDRARWLIQQLPWQFSYEYIPRGANLVCDRLCSTVLSQQEQGAYASARNELEAVWKTFHAARDVRNLESPLSDFCKRHFGVGSSLIPFSRRPPIYRDVASVASRIRDYAAMIRVGELLESDAKTVWPSSSVQALVDILSPDVESKTAVGSGASTPHLEREPVGSQQLFFEGVVFQISGLRSLQRDKEAAMLERKYRYLLHRFVAVAQRTQQRLDEERQIGFFSIRNEV
jgi:Reverse transcriptase-like